MALDFFIIIIIIIEVNILYYFRNIIIEYLFQYLTNLMHKICFK